MKGVIIVYTNKYINPYIAGKPNNGDRFVSGGFLAPFLLGGITGGLLAPAFYPRPMYGPVPIYPVPVYPPRYPVYY